MIIHNFNTIQAVAHCTRLRCSSVDRLLRCLEPYFVPFLPSSSDEVFSKAMSCLAATSTPSSEKLIGKREALNRLLLQDVEDIESNLMKLSRKLRDPEEQLEECFTLYVERLRSWGIDIGRINFRIVEDFPEPYSDIDGRAMSFDIYDQEEFGIPRGVAFRRKYLLPIVSCSYLAHELIHCVFSKVYSHNLTTGLEEGLCEVIGFIISSEVLGKEVSGNIMINSRLSVPTDQRWQIYIEAIRQATLIYRVYGLAGLKSILRRGEVEGRRVIKEIEKKLMYGNYRNLDLESGDVDAELDDFFSLLVGFPLSFNITPLAYLIGDKIQIGSHVEDWIEQEGFEPEGAYAALRELQEEVFLILTKDNRIISNEVKDFIETKALRYKA